MGTTTGWAAAATGRPAMRSPGRPPVARREHRQRFWAAIARGLSSEDAGVAAGVSPAVGSRWFREGGGMPPSRGSCRIRAVTCRSLSGRRSRSAALAVMASARSPGSWAAHRRRCRGSCGATRAPGAARWSTGRDCAVAPRPPGRPPEGRQAGVQPAAAPVCAGPAGRGDPRARTAGRCRARWRGSGTGGTSHTARTGAGPLPGARADRRAAAADFPDDESMRISHEAIYQALYIQGRGALQARAGRLPAHGPGPAGATRPCPAAPRRAWSPPR